MHSATATNERTSETEGLVLRAQSGDHAAYQLLCERLAPAVRAFARRRLGQSAAVDDFTQDVLLTFVDSIKRGRLEDPKCAAGFALGICRNLARERAKVRDRRESAAERFADVPEMTLPREPVLFDRVRLEDCLSQLTGRARKVLLGSFWEESTDAEIATALEINESNVRVIRHRSIAALRECLAISEVTWQRAPA